jgi:prolyl 4-hydroxylase
MAQPSVSPHFDRAISFLSGRDALQDLAAARAALGTGEESGDIRAVHLLAAFLAGGIGGPRDWPAAVALLRRWAPKDGLAARQVELISAMDLTADGDPARIPALKRLHPGKRIDCAAQLLTPAECLFLIQIAGPRMEPAQVITSQGAVDSQPAVRDNEHTAFPMLEEPPVVRAINRRIAAASGTDVRQGEPLQIMRYRQGQQYRTHLDRIASGTNQRLMTAIIYLNADYAGGETHFPALNLAVRGRPGDMLLFRNLDDGGKVDLEMRHAGLPPAKGVKYIASRWILQRPVYDAEGYQIGRTLWE